MEEGGGEGIGLELLALVALTIGVEGKTSVVGASQQHHARGWAPGDRGCRKCHSLRHRFTCCPCSLEPLGQLGQRVWIYGCLVHSQSLLHEQGNPWREGGEGTGTCGRLTRRARGDMTMDPRRLDRRTFMAAALAAGGGGL